MSEFKPYAVWIKVEIYEDEHSSEIDGIIELDCSGTFDTLKNATSFARRIHDFGKNLASEGGGE